jgi:hypothetical protein
MKTRSIELYYLSFDDNAGQAPPTALKPMKHIFAGHTTFREVSFSSPTIASAPTSNLLPAFAISVLASDTIRGLFHFHVSFNAESEPELGPKFDVRLVEARHMTNLDVGATRMRAEPGTSRGFVSACCLGPQAKRGIWIERRRGSTRREVSVFDVKCYLSAHSSDEDVPPDGWESIPDIDGRVVYEVNSFDLRGMNVPQLVHHALPKTFILDDLTHCTFCEVTGRIVVGMRSGKIKIL